jgi:hypothetical protein
VIGLGREAKQLRDAPELWSNDGLAVDNTECRAVVVGG